MNPQLIETERLLLKGLSPDDMRFIFEHYSKPKIKQLLGHRSEEEYLKEEQKHLKGYSSYNRSFMLFLLIDKATETIIGRCGLHNWNAEHNRAEIGYVMEVESYKQKGLMSEAVGAIIDFGFDQMNLHRIEALVGTWNVASLKVMEKFGFKQEGLLKEHYFTNGKFEDSLLFSLLQGDHLNQ